MAAGDVQEDGAIELQWIGFERYAKDGKVLIPISQIAAAQEHGWELIAETDEEVAEIMGASCQGLVIVARS